MIDKNFDNTKPMTKSLVTIVLLVFANVEQRYEGLNVPITIQD
ncbi:MAG TPA: hypothetical protein PKL69_14330 [Agitococcus sp.]|nr:hypothetical protein [Agitococcus sp.]